MSQPSKHTKPEGPGAPRALKRMRTGEITDSARDAQTKLQTPPTIDSFFLNGASSWRAHFASLGALPSNASRQLHVGPASASAPALPSAALAAACAPDHFSRLPDEILTIIFSYLRAHSLQRISAVCKRFLCVLLTPCLWHKITAIEKSLPTCALLAAAMRHPLTLSLHACVLRSDGSLPFTWSAARAVHRTERLQLFSTHIDPATLETVLRLLPGLRCLELAQSYVSDSMLEIVARCCPGLTHLNLRMVEHVTAVGLKRVFEGCPALSVVSLAWTCPTFEALAVVMEHSPRLRRLDLSGWGAVLRTEALVVLAERAQGLEALDLSDCFQLTDAALDALYALPRLSKLALSRCVNLNTGALIRLTSKPELHTFTMFGQTPSDLSHVQPRLLADVAYNKSVLSVLEDANGLEWKSKRA